MEEEAEGEEASSSPSSAAATAAAAVVDRLVAAVRRTVGLCSVRSYIYIFCFQPLFFGALQDAQDCWGVFPMAWGLVDDLIMG